MNLAAVRFGCNGTVVSFESMPTESGVGPETKAARTRRRILAAAATEFAARGYDGTSLRRVATAAGLQLGSLYFHFTSKDELITEVLRDAVDDALDRVRAAIDALGPDSSANARIAAAIGAHLAALHASRPRGTAVVRMLDPLPEPLQQENAIHAKRYGRYWTALLTDAQRAGAISPDLDPRVTRDLMFAAMNGSVRSERRGAAYVRTVSQNLCALLLGEPPGPATRRPSASSP